MFVSFLKLDFCEEFVFNSTARFKAKKIAFTLKKLQEF